ncbi:MAG: hypothetical protein PHY54_15065, partial [Methylococcales bacterium]|nr:hypothetical protein [Methylococcales bacterium]
MRISFLKLGWRSLTRDLRAGELRLLMVAVTLAVAAMTAVGFFADRLKGGLQRDAHQLLGGDAVVVSDNHVPASFVAQAQSLGLQQSLNLTFPTMARAPDELGGGLKLVALKVVDASYPLRGKVRVSGKPDGSGELAQGVPALGQAWVDAGLLDALGLQMGAEVLLGEKPFRISHIIVNEPDRGAGFMNFSPRVMINQADIEATGLIQPASRLRYRLAVAGGDQAVQAFVDWAQQQVNTHAVRGMRVEALDGGRPELSSTLARAEKFLSL